MIKWVMTAGVFLGIMIMLTPVFGFQYPVTGIDKRSHDRQETTWADPEKVTAQALFTTAHEEATGNQYFVSSDGDCGAGQPCYGKIQDAIDAAPDGSDILVKQGVYEESISLGSAKTVLVKGGYDSAYTQQIANTTFIQGLGQTTIQATGGSLKFQMLSILPVGSLPSDLNFYADPGFRKGYGATNPMAGLSPNNLVYLYYNDEGLLQNTSGSKLATSTDGINFADGATPTTYLYHPKYVLMPDGITRRTYMPAGNETARVVSKYITTGTTRTDDPGERYNGVSIDNGAIGIVEVFPDNIGGYLMLYIGDKFNINNIRRAYSPPGDNGMNFSFTTEDILGDASRPAGSDRNVDQFSLLLPDSRRRLFTMAYGGSRIDSYISSDHGTSFTQESGSRITTSDFSEFSVYSLHDPSVVRLSDGRYRMYVCARVDYDTSAAEDSSDRYKFVIVSATTR